MGMELQGLIDRINAEGLEKAEATKAALIEAAQAEAKGIVEKAKAESEEMMKNAVSENEKLEQRAKSAVQQAARDIILGLRAEITKRLQNVVKHSIDEAMTPTMMAQLVTTLMANDQAATKSGVELDLSKTISDADVKAILAALSKTFETQPQITLRNDFAAGFKVGVSGSDLRLDLSDEAITAIVCGYVGPKVAAILEQK